MNDDRLHVATQALRDSTADERDPDFHAATLKRILATKKLSGRPMPRRLPHNYRFVLGLAAALVCLSLGALAARAHLRTVADEQQRSDARNAARGAQSAGGTPLVPRQSTDPIAEPIAAQSNEPASAPPPFVPALEPTLSAKSASLAPLPQQPQLRPAISATAERAFVSEDELYRRAHEAHFRSSDATVALAKWDEYLRVAGASGTYALEARFNRAVCLAKLGRTAEARRAFQPFADGDYGAYRRAEAQERLKQL